MYTKDDVDRVSILEKTFFDALYHYCFDARLWHRALSYSYDNIELFCKAYLLLL